ncbi:MAG: M3 family metallopeptidase [Mesosutterella sp.]|nr:M3 family metallopeptidase [Mesosutterella sp.]
MAEAVEENALQAPEWQMEDAYGDIGSERWKASARRVRELTDELSAAGRPAGGALLSALALYEEARMRLSSLKAFVKCLGAKDSTDARIDPENAALAQAEAALAGASAPLFASIEALAPEDPLWEREPLAHWRFEISRRAGNWKHRLSAPVRAEEERREASEFKPLGGCFKRLQKEVAIEARRSDGTPVTVRAARMIAILKGDPDPVLRETTGRGIERHYEARGEAYAKLLNALHGFRLEFFGQAGVSPLEVSLHQNRLSREGFEAMFEAIRGRLPEIRSCVTLRAPWLGRQTLPFWDLMAPAPQGRARALPPPIPYPEGFETVCEALRGVSPEIEAFFRMMREKRWVDAKPSDRKIGGAFYSRFEEFRMPRVFSTYQGSLASVIQQSHEMGHAFHYWVMRDLPAVQTEFPMTLTEMASTFDEAVVRDFLFRRSDFDGRFAMLWQDLKSWANFMMNVPARCSFELAFLRERKEGEVSAGRCRELMAGAWKRWYGDCALPDVSLWAYKLHYYKTDQLIYNYPYTVGFLLSQILLQKWKSMGADFYPFYVRMLRDTGRMTVDALVRAHFGADCSDPAFWQIAMKGLDEALSAFRQYAPPAGTPAAEPEGRRAG